MTDVIQPTPVSSVRDLVPDSSLPLAYYAVAHGALLIALLSLVFEPAAPGASFYHPLMAALVHLLTLGWMSGSILGSLYIVAPLVLRVPLPVRAADWAVFGAFAAGTAGMVGGFWTGRYEPVAWSSGFVTVAIVRVAVRVSGGLRRSPVPAGIALHVGLAFANVLIAAAVGALLALNRTRGFLEVSPLAITFAHAHLAAVGWGTMMVVGLAYRLIPMIVPSAMPTGARLAISALLLEAGTLALASALVFEPRATVVGTGLIGSGLVFFAMQMRASVRRKMPRPPALPRRDWSSWQAHAALLWLLVALVAGSLLSVGAIPERRLELMWLYGVAGLLGFLAQIVTGIQGRLVPMYAWYRAFSALGRPPARSANSLPSARFAGTIFGAWAVGVPLLAGGLTWEGHAAVSGGAALLSGAVVTGFVYLTYMLRAARRP